MKTNMKVVLTTMCAVLASSAGCNKKETAPDTRTPPPTASVPSPPVADAQPKAGPAQTVDTATEGQDRVQGLIDRAKTLNEEEKYVEALNIIGELSKQTLSPEQQMLVDGLKKTAQQQVMKAAVEKKADGALNALDGTPGSDP